MPGYYQSKKPTGYPGERPWNNTKAKPAYRGKKKPRPTRAMKRIVRSTEIEKSFVDICRENMPPATFEMVMRDAEQRVAEVVIEDYKDKFKNIAKRILGMLDLVPFRGNSRPKTYRPR